MYGFVFFLFSLWFIVMSVAAFLLIILSILHIAMGCIDRRINRKRIERGEQPWPL